MRVRWDWVKTLPSVRREHSFPRWDRCLPEGEMKCLVSSV